MFMAGMAAFRKPLGWALTAIRSSTTGRGASRPRRATMLGLDGEMAHAEATSAAKTQMRSDEVAIEWECPPINLLVTSFPSRSIDRRP